MYADFPSLLSLKNFLTSKFTWKWHANCHLNQHLNLNPKSTCSSSSLEYQLYVPVFFNILNSALGSWLDKERYGNIRRVPCSLSAKSKGAHGDKKVFFYDTWTWYPMLVPCPCSSSSKKLGIFWGIEWFFENLEERWHLQMTATHRRSKLMFVWFETFTEERVIIPVMI